MEEEQAMEVDHPGGGVFQQQMEEGQAIEVDHDDIVAIVNVSQTRLESASYRHYGTSIDLYKFSNDQSKTWKHGQIFHASNVESISFKGIMGDIDADDIYKRDAAFLVHEPSQRESVVDMIVRSSKLKHAGILKPYIVGFNTQISKVVSAFSSPTSSLADWLGRKSEGQVPYIPIEVQQLIRTGYQAIERIWREGFTSDDLANLDSYDMIGSRIKINPLRIRSRRAEENDKVPLRRAFGEMIRDHIFSIWKDVELLDFIELLGNPAAENENDVLGHPVLLLPPTRELMYHKFDMDMETLSHDQKIWLEANANPGVDWKQDAAAADLTLGEIIVFQEKAARRAQQAAQGGQQAAPEAQQAAPEGQQAAPFGQQAAQGGQAAPFGQQAAQVWQPAPQVWQPAPQVWQHAAPFWQPAQVGQEAGPFWPQAPQVGHEAGPFGPQAPDVWHEAAPFWPQAPHVWHEAAPFWPQAPQVGQQAEQAPQIGQEAGPFWPQAPHVWHEAAPFWPQAPQVGQQAEQAPQVGQEAGPFGPQAPHAWHEAAPFWPQAPQVGQHAEQAPQVGQQAEQAPQVGQQDAPEGQQAELHEGFSPNFSGALHFASVATSHYLQRFKKLSEGNWREEIKGRVDRLLRQVLPRLLSRRYNANYAVGFRVETQADLPNPLAAELQYVCTVVGDPRVPFWITKFVLCLLLVPATLLCCSLICFLVWCCTYLLWEFFFVENNLLWELCYAIPIWPCTKEQIR